MAGNSVEYIFELIDKYTPQLRKMQKAQLKFNKQIKQIDKSIKNTTEGLRKFGQATVRAGKSLTMYLTLPIFGLLGASVAAAAKIERMTVAFFGLMGSMEKARDIVDVINKFTALTPFRLQKVAASARALLISGVKKDDLIDRLRMLGDIASAAVTDIEPLALVFQRIKERGRATFRELRILIYRKIPIVRELSAMLKTNVNTIYELSRKGKLSFKIIERAMENMTKKGHFAFQGTIRASKTLIGLLTTMRDNLMFMGREIGDVLLPYIKVLVILVIRLARNFVVFAKSHRVIVLIGIAFLTLIAILGPLLIIVGKLFLGIIGLKYMFAFAIPVLKGFFAAIIAIKMPILLIVAAIALLGTALYIAIKNWDMLKKSFRDNAVLKSTLFIVEKIVKLVGRLLIPMKVLGSIFDKIGGKLENVFIDKISAISESLIAGTIDINLNAPKGTVSKVSTTKKDKNVNLGVNMRNT